LYKRIDRKAIRVKKHYRMRRKISGTAQCPRLAVFRSARHIYAQIIDDTQGVTLTSAGTQDPSLKGVYGGNKAAAAMVGSLIAEKAKAAGITSVVFDRGGLLYHGRIAALADAAREGGLKF